MSSHRPAWQTEELAEEWVDQDEHSSARWQDSVSSHAVSSSDISLTEALPSTFIRGGSTSPASHAVGTFVVKEDVPAAPFLPKTPGKNNKNQIKDFFSPMPLETMFEPPSPPPANYPPLPSTSHQSTAPTVPSRLSKVYVPSDTSMERRYDDEILETDIPNMVGFDGRRPGMKCQFTFSVPDASQGAPMAQSTPSGSSHAPPVAPPTDPRLRLFQFQYDTFTRDHLSAMVDSIAINTPSGGSSSPNASGNILSRVTEVDAESMTRMRSTKRIKLSPATDFLDDRVSPDPPPSRPQSRRDYVGESRNLMEQIRQARDFSTISTVASARSRAEDDSRDESITFTPPPQVHLNVSRSIPSSSAPSSGTMSSKRSGYSSLGYRQQAADLMAQIKQDMKGSKRLFSGDTEISHTTRVVSDQLLLNKENEPRRVKPNQRVGSKSGEELVREFGNLSIEVWQAHVQVKVEPLSQLPYVAVIPPTPTIGTQTHQNRLALPDGPSYPSSSIRSGTTDDLNRFVSSSTATGTTLTAGSAESFVKHAGPKQMTRIGPEDVAGALSDRVGKMVLDRETMRWVRDTAIATADVDGRAANPDAERDVDAESEDPFKDIESLRDDDSRAQEAENDESRLQAIEEAEVEDAEEVALNSFSFDDSSAAVVQVMTGVVEQNEEDADYLNAVADETTDSDDSRDDELDTIQNHPQETEDFSLDQFPPPPCHAGAAFSTPLPVRSTAGPAGSTPFPSVRSALKSNSQTPVSAMKDPNRNKTPAPSGHRRSVSFSDGKKDGPIRGLTRNADEDEVLETESEDHDLAKSGSGSLFVPSARTKRIADMLEGFEDSASDNPSPTKTSSSAGRPSSDELRPLAPRRPTRFANAALHNSSQSSRRAFSRSYSHRPGSAANTAANATFLTECSFGVTHDRLVQVITDVQPFEPYWEELSSIDISKKNVESVARLKEFLPKLDTLCLNDNQISWLSGIPGTVRTLSVASNMLTGVTSFSHLVNLEHLDISRNNIDSLQQLCCLRHLRELRADGNSISNIDGLQKMDGLVKLSLQSNGIRDTDFRGFRWTRLEMLNISHNGLLTIQGLEMLPALIALNLDSNSLTDLGLEGENTDCMTKLRILRVSGNKLQRLDGAHYPNLRTLYADSNNLSSISHCNRLRRLENLSLRNQGKGKLNLSIRDVRDLKRLYLSGNPLTAKFMTEPCYNLIYFELAACRLTSLPPNFGQLVPNVRVLNLNYNFLEDVKPLEGLTRLKKLTIIGSRLKGTKGLIKMAQGMPEIEMVDFRMNPCTLGWYLPLLVRDVPGALQPSEESPGTGKAKFNVDERGGKKTESRSGGGDGESGRYTVWRWQELDCKFRRDLPDEAYVGRLAYRGLIMRACREIRMLDGVEVSDKERDKANRLLTGILGKSRAAVVSQ